MTELPRKKKTTARTVTGSDRAPSVKVGGSVGGSVVLGDNNIVTTGWTSRQAAVFMKQLAKGFTPIPFNGICPYKGLDTFMETDAELFFGREELVKKLVSRVQNSQTLFITGPSGSGKSSLARAGLIPALKSGKIQEQHSRDWKYATLKPGDNPLEVLENVFSALKTPELADYFHEHRSEQDVILKCARSILSPGGEDRLVLFLDQFEEVFTLVNKEKDRIHLFNLLHHAATAKGSRVTLLFSMRSDFIPNCAPYPKLNVLLSEHFIQIGTMEPEELASAIAQPALRVGLRIEPELVSQIINDMQGEPGALPLMQFALVDLFDSQHGKNGVPALTRKDYLNRGGIHEVLNKHAKKTVDKFNEKEEILARFICSGLIKVGSGTQATRNTASLEELVPADAKARDVKTVLQKLQDARLVTTDESSGKYTIAHEKLISAWSWLRELVDKNREAIAVQNKILNDANDWEEGMRHESFLYRGARLANAREKLEDKQLTLSGLAMEFIEAAEKAYADALEHEKKRADHLERIIRIGLARQLTAQAQSIYATRASDQLKAVLLATQSMKIYPTAGAAQILQNNLLARPILRMTIGDRVNIDSPLSLKISRDGKYVITGNNNKTIRVWNAVTGQDVATLNHDAAVVDVVFSPDGKYIASASLDTTVRIWKTTTWKEHLRRSHGNQVNSVAFSPDNSLVVSASKDQNAAVWNVSTGAYVAGLFHDEKPKNSSSLNGVQLAMFSPDGKYVVSANRDDTIVWRVEPEEIVAKLGIRYVKCMAFSPDGKLIALGIASPGVASVWSMERKREITAINHDAQPGHREVNDIAFSVDSNWIVSGGTDRTVRVWRATTGDERVRMTHDDSVVAVAFSADGKYVVSGSYDHTARVWETETGKEIAHLTHKSAVVKVAFHPNGRHIVSADWGGEIYIWDPITAAATLTYEIKAAESMAFGPNGSSLAVASYGEIRIWNHFAEMEKIQFPSPSDYQRIVSFSPDGKFLSSAGYQHVLIIDTRTGKITTKIQTEATIESVLLGPNSKYMVVGLKQVSFMEQGWIELWNVTAKQKVELTYGGVVKSVAFSSTGKYVVAGHKEAVRVWKTSTGKEVAHMVHDDIVNSVAFSPDEKYVLSGSKDKTIRKWAIETGEEVWCKTYESEVEFVSYSADGKKVLSRSGRSLRLLDPLTEHEITREIPSFTRLFNRDGRYILGVGDRSARVWEFMTGEEIAQMVHDNDLMQVAFSPDGNFVASRSNDRIARIWKFLPQDLIGAIYPQLTRNLTRAEWKQYIGDALPYQAVCEDLPIEPEEIATS